MGWAGMITLCWREGGRDWDLLCLLFLWRGWWEWEGVDLVELLSSLSTLQAVTVTKPTLRPSQAGDSSFSLTLPDREIICQNFVKFADYSNYLRLGAGPG